MGSKEDAVIALNKMLAEDPLMPAEKFWQIMERLDDLGG